MGEPSYWLKVRRAMEHAEAIKDAVTAYGQSDSCTVVREHDEHGHEHYCVARIARLPDLDGLALTFGDFIHNLRSALDHLVYTVAAIQTRTDPPADERILQFPITDTADDFARQVYRIRSLTSAVRTVIERVQPYNRPHPSLPPILALLRNFSNGDKHKLLSVAVLGQIDGHVNVKVPPGHSVKRTANAPFDGIVDGTKIFTFTVEPPCLDVDYNGEVSLAIGVWHAKGPSGFNGTGIVTMLTELCGEVETVIDAIECHI